MDKNHFVGEDGERYEIITKDALQALLREKMEDFMNTMKVPIAEIENSMRGLESQLDEAAEKANSLGAATDSIIARQEQFLRTHGPVSQVSVGVQVDVPRETSGASPAMVSMSHTSTSRNKDFDRFSPTAGPSRSSGDFGIDLLQVTTNASAVGNNLAARDLTPKLVKVPRLPPNDECVVPNWGSRRYFAPDQIPGSLDAVPGPSTSQLDNNTVFYAAPSRPSSFSHSEQASRPNVSNADASDVSDSQASSNVGVQSGAVMHLASTSQNPIRNAGVSTVPSRNIRYPPRLPAQPIPPLESRDLVEEPPPKPVLKIERCNEGIVLAWNLTLAANHAPMRSYQLYVCQLSNNIPLPVWRKLSEFKALPLPMACTLTHFAGGGCYNFAVRATDMYQRVGHFSDIASINMKSLSYNIGL